MKLFLKILRVTLFSISALILAAGAVLTLLPYLTNFSPLSVFTVESGSMEPALPVHSLIITKKPGNAAAVKIGDIITFAEPGYENKYITHRVVDTKSVGQGQLFLTQGDANARPDAWEVSYGRVQGVHLFHIPYVGYAVSFIRSLPGLLLLVILPVLVISISEIRKIINHLVNKKVRHILSRLPAAKHKSYPRRKFSRSTSSRPLDSAAPRYKKPLFASLLAFGVITLTAPTLAQFTSNVVSITGSSLSTAAIFPSASPSPTTTPSPTPEPSPSSTPEPSTSPQPCDLNVDINTSNTDTGPGSTNENTVAINQDCVITEENQTDIENEIQIDANTGDNTQTNNTDTGDQTTGDINIDLNIKN